MDVIIKNPTNTSAGVVANDGIARKIGDKNKDNPKRTAATIAVSPVFPPSAAPAALSTNVVTVEVPIAAPAVVPRASARSAPLILGSFPLSSNKSAFAATPIRVPSVSNKSTNKNAHIIITKSIEKTLLKSIANKVGARLGMEIPLLKSGSRLYHPASGIGV